jgi:hypothetical protein
MDSSGYRRYFKHRFLGNWIWTKSIGKLLKKLYMIIYKVKQSYILAITYLLQQNLNKHINF